MSWTVDRDSNLNIMPESLRQFSEQHIDENCGKVSGYHDNELFFNCKFRNVSGLTLKNCDLNASTFDVRSVADALGFTLTLNCYSFRDVEYSQLLFDLMLTLLTMTKGNDAKREALKTIIGSEKYATFSRLLKRLE